MRQSQLLTSGNLLRKNAWHKKNIQNLKHNNLEKFINMFRNIGKAKKNQKKYWEISVTCDKNFAAAFFIQSLQLVLINILNSGEI